MKAPGKSGGRLDERIKLNDLRVLMTVATTGGMATAAAALHTSQPAISRTIRELEQLLGVRLLDRHRRGVASTDFGKALLECGSVVFDEIRAGLKKVEFLADPSAGEVVIGCNPIIASSFVPFVIDRLLREFPRMSFRIETGTNETLLRGLRERRFDLLIARKLDPEHAANFVSERLFNESYAVAAGVNHRHAKARKVQLRQLMDEPWILAPPEAVIGSMSKRAFSASGLGLPRHAVHSVSPEVRFALLATGRFLTILPTSLNRFSTRPLAVRFLPLDLPIEDETIDLIVLKGRTLNPAAEMFMDCAREAARLPTGAKDRKRSRKSPPS